MGALRAVRVVVVVADDLPGSTNDTGGVDEDAFRLVRSGLCPFTGFDSEEEEGGGVGRCW